MAPRVAVVQRVELHQVAHVRARGVQHLADLDEDVLRLGGDVVGVDDLAVTVQGELPADEDQVPRDHALGEGPRAGPLPRVGDLDGPGVPTPGGNRFDLHQQSLVRESVDARRHAGRIGRLQILGAHFVDLIRIRSDSSLGSVVAVEDVHLDQVFETDSRRFEHPGHAVVGIAGLRDDVAGRDGHTKCVHRNLPAHEHQFADAPALAQRHGHAPVPVPRGRQLDLLAHAGRDGIDLDQNRVARKACDAHRGIHRSGTGEVLELHAGHTLPVVPERGALTFEPVPGVELHEVPVVGAPFVQHPADELEGVPRLGFEVAGGDDPRVGRQRDLTAHEHEIPHAPALREGHRDRPVPVVGGHQAGLLHVRSVSGPLLRRHVSYRTLPPRAAWRLSVWPATNSCPRGMRIRTSGPPSPEG